MPNNPNREELDLFLAQAEHSLNQALTKIKAVPRYKLIPSQADLLGILHHINRSADLVIKCGEHTHEGEPT